MNTVKKYILGFKRFIIWTEKYPEITSILPCNELYIGLYLQHLLETAKHFSAIESAFYSIKWAHNIAGVSNSCDSEFIKSIVEAAKRLLARPVKKKEPVDAGIMKKLLHKYKESTSLKDMRLIAMCSLMYSGFLRYNEMCNIKAKHVTFHNDYLEIFISKSKTDCYRNGNNVVISKLDTIYCPVDTLNRYFEASNIVNTSDMYIFRPISFLKKRKSFVLRQANTRLSYTRAREIIKEALSEIGINVVNFGLHSFRSGGATAAANNKVADRLFKAHGRWKSETAKDGYIADNLHERLSVSKRLGL